jgi:hypothetical protein
MVSWELWKSNEFCYISKCLASIWCIVNIPSYLVMQATNKLMPKCTNAGRNRLTFDGHKGWLGLPLCLEITYIYIFYTFQEGEWDIIVNIMSVLEVVWLRNNCMIPGRGKEGFLFSIVSTRTVMSTEPHFQWVLGWGSWGMKLTTHPLFTSIQCPVKNPPLCIV